MLAWDIVLVVIVARRSVTGASLLYRADLANSGDNQVMMGRYVGRLTTRPRVLLSAHPSRLIFTVDYRLSTKCGPVDNR